MGNGLIVKHNEIIEGKYSMSITEVKIIAKLTSVIKMEDDDFKRYQFKAADVLKELNLGENNYATLKESIDKLVTRKIELKQEESTLVTTFLSSAEYFDNSTIELEFSPKLKPYLLQLKSNFTKYYLADILTLKSFYAVRIYELLKQYEKIKERVISVEELKSMLKITEKSYSLYANFKAKVLAISEREINEKTDLSISFKEIKTGRKVTDIKFIIKSKVEGVQEQKNIEISEEALKLWELLPEEERVEIRKQKFDELLKEHSFEMLSSDIEYCKTKSVKDFFAYFLKSVKNGHYSAAEVEKKKKKEAAKIEKKKAAEEEAEKAEKDRALAREKAVKIYNNFTEEEIENYKKKLGYYSIPEKLRGSISAKDMIIVSLMTE